MIITNEHLRLGRGLTGLSVAMLAHMAGVSGMTISRIEGGVEVKERTMMRVGGALERHGVTFDDAGVTFDGRRLVLLPNMGRLTGQRLATARDRLKVSRSQVASASGLSMETLAKIESYPDLDDTRNTTLVQLISALVELGYHFGRNGREDRVARA